jgi:hypothetical protein
MSAGGWMSFSLLLLLQLVIHYPPTHYIFQYKKNGLRFTTVRQHRRFGSFFSLHQSADPSMVTKKKKRNTAHPNTVWANSSTSTLYEFCPKFCSATRFQRQMSCCSTIRAIWEHHHVAENLHLRAVYNTTVACQFWNILAIVYDCQLWSGTIFCFK